jgi:hypothetical protein
MFVHLPMDFEQTNFDHFFASDIAQQYLVSPKRATATTACCVEVTLLKILMELETPLWAFKVIMDWACDAAQSSYKFVRQQSSYKAQLDIASKWVGMEHLCPTVVTTPLPGKRNDNSISVMMFDFVSQLHSLLSDRKLNSPQVIWWLMQQIPSHTTYLLMDA